MSSLDDFEARLAILAAVEDSKTALIQDLVAHVKRLEGGLSNARDQLDRERRVSDMFQHSDKEKEIELRQVRMELAMMSYVSVLIDGDHMHFTTSLLKAGEGGGRQAARVLRTKVVEYLHERCPTVPANVRIVIRIYANLNGLAKTYQDAKVLSNVTEFGLFINGFNKEDSLCDLVSAGDGKECADEKIKAMFQIGLENVQCLHVVFGGSADSGYARLLGPYRDSSKVTLLEGPPFAKELKELSDCLPTMKITEVFRQSKLHVDKTPSPPTSPGSENSAVTNYASVVAVKGQQPVMQNSLTAAHGSASAARIARNAAGQRIDVALLCSTAEMKAMKVKKYCNEYHICGKCSFTKFNKGCSFDHGTRVTGRDLEALRAVARLSACQRGLGCKDAQCILGHRCPKEPCRKGKMCLFPPGMHGIDTNIVAWEG
ncbi:C-x8-C-x5-C-x3-H type zinc finger protein-like protein [Clohesyomyces aquaticus]|uniref:C-x8-C-x5-C-x3-H type zinc finger protein-like protein n=1 Tax=Clohesyomyces aquaticus TaxID=1231657 RepID=A0A1Y1YUV7_9PLEO|nr:C-x8-C-x5-C-x3-H type zinc finger protein-like protein [Clohesyomyces aquaticus]